MIEHLAVLGLVGELTKDMILVLKIFVLLTIISYVTQHLGKGPLAILLILGISWFVIFDYFYFFGGVYVLYVLVTFGATGILIDFFFVSPGAGGGVGEIGEATGGISSGKDLVQRQAAAAKARQSIANSLRRGR